MSAAADPRERSIEDTRRWVERAVIGLNLCPFAKAVHVKGQVHYAVTQAADFAPALEALEQEAADLLARPDSERDTTLLVLPRGFEDFLLFHQLVTEAERLLVRRGHEGALQLASFHPRFVFAGAEEDDPANWTNRAPWPTLQLLREASVERGVAAIPDPEAIYGANIETLRRLGRQGWDALGVGPS